MLTLTRKTQSVAQAMGRAQTVDLSAVTARYARDYEATPEQAALMQQECTRYLVLCAIYPGELGMNGPVDDYWHTLIVHTVDYARFCELVAGRFIHHVPNPVTSSKKSADCSCHEEPMGCDKCTAKAKACEATECQEDVLVPEAIVEESGYARTIRLYGQHFGPPPSCWPSLKRGGDKCKGDDNCRSQCNSCRKNDVPTRAQGASCSTESECGGSGGSSDGGCSTGRCTGG